MSSVYVVDGARTPFLKARGKPGPFAASDLALFAGRELLTRLPLQPTDMGETIMGCMMPSPDEANIGRLIGLRLDCGIETPGWTVQRNCASGMQSLDSAIKDIQTGRHEMVLAGGTEAMSRAPLLYRNKIVQWFAGMMRAKTAVAKFAMLSKLDFSALLNPIIALKNGLSDPLYGINMGQTAELLAYQFDITREAMDAFALRSQQRALEAYKAGHFDDELTTVYDHAGKYFAADDGIRADSSLNGLAKLKPFFDRQFGRVTAGNSSQITDGSAVLLLASESAVRQHRLPVLGRIVDVQWAALNPEVMGLGPVFASTPILQKHNLRLEDIDYWEINEAFAAQVIACLRAWQSSEFCQHHFAMDALGELDESRLNVDGGAIALGHPVGATGARLVLHLLHVLKRNNAKRGMATLCIGGGQGGAMLLENVQ